MGIEKIKKDLREVRRLSRHKINCGLVDFYRKAFEKLPPLEREVMQNCYIKGDPFYICANKLKYSEVQIYRIIKKGVKKLAKEFC